MNQRLNKTVVTHSGPSNRPYDVCDSDYPGFLLRVEPTGRQTFYYRGRLTRPDRTRGSRRYYHIGDARHWTVAQARNEARRLAGMLADGIDPDESKRREKFGTIGALIDGEYRRNVLDHRRAGSSTYDRMKRHFGFLWDRALEDPTIPNAVQNWQAQRLKDGTTASTINKDVGALRAALSYAVERGYLEAHPLAKVKRVKEPQETRVRYLSPDEDARLHAALDARDERIREGRDSANAWRRERGYRELPDLRAVAFVDHVTPLILVAKNTGMRRGELFDLNWRDVDLDAALLTVRAHTTKSHKTRRIPLNRTARETLRQWKDQTTGTGFVFPGKEGGRLDNIHKSWQSIVKEAGIPDFRFHDLRHDFASKLVMAGIDLNTVRELLGHGDLTMTLRYAHLAPERLSEAVCKIDNVLPFRESASG